MGLLDKKVAVITGAGGGLGEAYAKLFAQEGASVVVNDLGGPRDGSGKDASYAQKVADAIVKDGGKAVANGSDISSMAGGEALFNDAIKAFGKVDILVNNAGILRDGTFAKMSEDQWDSVVRVHLKGTFCVTLPVFKFMKDNGGGVIVNTSSTSGLIGNFGQANYAAAKLGIVGLSKSIALDMQRFNVRSNCISPFAWSRLIGTIPTETEEEKARVAKIQQMGPEKIAPVAAYLLGDASKDVTGQIFGVRMNEIFLMSQSRPIRSVHRGEGWTVQSLAEHGMPALKGSFYKLERSGDVFNWDAI